MATVGGTSDGLYLESLTTTGEMGTSGLAKVPICMLSVLKNELKSFAFQSANSLSEAECLDFAKYLCSFCRVGLRLFAIMMSDRRERRPSVEVGEKESLLDIGLTGCCEDITVT